MSIKPNDYMSPGEYEGLRRKLVADAMSKFSFTKPEKHSDVDKLIIRAKDVDLEVKRSLRPILQAGGGHDIVALRALAATAYVEKFSKSFNKEELENILAVIYLEMFTEFVNTNPNGNDIPDLLGGV